MADNYLPAPHSLLLSEQDRAEYSKRWGAWDAMQSFASLTADPVMSKKARQGKTALYWEFVHRQLPAEPPSKHEREDALTIEQRLDRVEAALKIGRHAEDF